MITLSPGVAYGCFNLLRIVAEHRIQLVRLSSEVPRFETLRTEDLLDVCQRLNWIRADNVGDAVLTPAGDCIITLSSERQRLRQAVIHYVQIERPDWLQLSIDGRARCMKFGPTGIIQTISEAYLAEGYDSEVIAFWDLLAAIARGQRSAALNTIGRRGERLSLDFEKQRTGQEPAWRSIESNSDGYDVLSVVSATNQARMQIEVKASTIGIRGMAHITRNEWDQTELMPHHTLHFWDLHEEIRPKLAIVARTEVAAHVPNDGTLGRWTECEIPFSAFENLFADPIALLENFAPSTSDRL
ncbi:protein NO VEIN domain-containing protein [Burkholderia cepacia]|uniref:protein NO VEIN domain-containing protein n=1 Tax=Burkholderia cepacia TaxID=292 RepID=UPI002FE27F08